MVVLVLKKNVYTFFLLRCYFYAMGCVGYIRWVVPIVIVIQPLQGWVSFNSMG